MKNLKIILPVAIGVLIVSGLGFASAVDAFQGRNFTQGNNQRERQFNCEQREEMRVVFDSGDYNAWLEAVPEDSPMRGVINEGNFDRFVEMHNLMGQNDFKGAKAIADELGLPQIQGGRGIRFGQKGNPQQHQAMMDAITNVDYNAWFELTPKNSLIREQINADNFSQLVEMHNLIQAKDFEGAQSIADELGLKKPQYKGFGQGGGVHKGKGMINFDETAS